MEAGVARESIDYGVYKEGFFIPGGNSSIICLDDAIEMDQGKINGIPGS